MFRKAIVHLLILFLIVGFVGFIGCDDDGDEGTPPPTPPPPTPPEPEPTPTPQVLAQANNAVVPGGGERAFDFTVTSPKTIKGTVTWTSPPDELVVLFMQEGSGSEPHAMGGSPLTTIHTVTADEVAASPNWMLIVVNYDVDAIVNILVETVP